MKTCIFLTFLFVAAIAGAQSTTSTLIMTTTTSATETSGSKDAQSNLKTSAAADAKSNTTDEKNITIKELSGVEEAGNGAAVVINTSTLAALHKIYLQNDEKKTIEELVTSAVMKIGKLTGSTSYVEFLDARVASEEVCRGHTQIITARLRKHETGFSMLTLISTLATGLSLGTNVIGSAKFTSLIAGTTTAYDKIYNKQDTEHSDETLRTARSAISAARIELGRQADEAFSKWQDPQMQKQKTQNRNTARAALTTLVNTCRG